MVSGVSVLPPCPFTFVNDERLKLAVSRLREEYPKYRDVLEAVRTVVSL
jgi:hypothetical protein